MKHSIFMVVLLSGFVLSESSKAQAEECKIFKREYQVPRGSYLPNNGLIPSEPRAVIKKTSNGPELSTVKDSSHPKTLGDLGYQIGNAEDATLKFSASSDAVVVQFYAPAYFQDEYQLDGKYCVELYKNKNGELSRDLWALFASNPEGSQLKVRTNLSRKEFDKLISGDSETCKKMSDKDLSARVEALDREKYKACKTGAKREVAARISALMGTAMSETWSHPITYYRHPIQSFIGTNANALYEVENGYFRQNDTCWEKEKNDLKMNACLIKRDENNENREVAGVKSNPTQIKSGPAQDYFKVNSKLQESVEHPVLRANPETH